MGDRAAATYAPHTTAQPSNYYMHNMNTSMPCIDYADLASISPLSSNSYKLVLGKVNGANEFPLR